MRNASKAVFLVLISAMTIANFALAEGPHAAPGARSPAGRPYAITGGKKAQRDLGTLDDEQTEAANAQEQEDLKVFNSLVQDFGTVSAHPSALGTGEKSFDSMR